MDATTGAVERGTEMTNADLFRKIFGLYAEEFWSLPTDKMTAWLVADAPTIDVVEVVRCQYCEQWEYDAIFSDGWCRGRHQGDPNWFCADGKRKEGEGNV